MNDDMQVTVKVSELAELAVHFHKLQIWLGRKSADVQTTAVRYISRKLVAFLESQEITTIDLTNHPYDSGTAADIVDSINPVTPEEEGRIVETISPIVCWKGRVIRPAEVVVAKAQKQSVGEKHVAQS